MNKENNMTATVLFVTILILVIAAIGIPETHRECKCPKRHNGAGRRPAIFRRTLCGGFSDAGSIHLIKTTKSSMNGNSEPDVPGLVPG